VVFCNATGILKPPSCGQTFPYHQDGAYYGPADGRYLIANVYLQDVTPDNGSLKVVSRTHDRLWPHEETHGKKSVTLPTGAVVVHPQATAGDVLWFHLWTVHGSDQNRSTHARCAVRCGYAAEQVAS
jgi:ectoine hydroxylase-related dioxygenase (phytanoyl-CoA dioxygenase family)